MLIVVQKGIRGGICHAIYPYAKANNKCMKDYDKNEESSYLKYWNKNTLCEWVMCQKLPLSDFKCDKEISQLMKIFKKAIMEIVKLMLMFNIQKNCMKFIMFYPIFLKE